NTLALTAGELRRPPSEVLCPETHALHCFTGPGDKPCRIEGPIGVPGPRGEDAKHVHPRVQRRGGILEDVLHVRAEAAKRAGIASRDLPSITSREILDPAGS